MNLGHKQKKLFRIAKKEGYVTSNAARRIYGNYDQGIASLESLEARGLLKFAGNGRWKVK